jgi:hypothetical protein
MHLRPTALLRSLSFGLFAAALAGPTFAQEQSELAPTAPGAVYVSVSYSINSVLENSEPQAVEKIDIEYRRLLYQRAKKECADVLATIAKDCKITGINVSAQVNPAYPGQQATIYASSTVNMDIILKDE